MDYSSGNCPYCSRVNSYSATHCLGCGRLLPWASAVAPTQRLNEPPLPIPDPRNSQWTTAQAQEPVPSPVGCLALFGAAILAILAAAIAESVVSGGTWLLVIGTAIWVGFDASSIGVKRGQIKGLGNSSVAAWVVGCLVLWCLVFPAYLLARPTLKRINGK